MREQHIIAKVLGTVFYLWQQNTNKSVEKYGFVGISTLLPQVQNRTDNKYHTIEDDAEQ